MMTIRVHEQNKHQVNYKTGVFYLSSPEGAARPFHQLALLCVILLTDGPKSDCLPASLHIYIYSVFQFLFYKAPKLDFGENLAVLFILDACKLYQ